MGLALGGIKNFSVSIVFLFPPSSCWFIFNRLVFIYP